MRQHTCTHSPTLTLTRTCAHARSDAHTHARVVVAQGEAAKAKLAALKAAEQKALAQAREAEAAAEAAKEREVAALGEAANEQAKLSGSLSLFKENDAARRASVEADARRSVSYGEVSAGRKAATAALARFGTASESGAPASTASMSPKASINATADLGPQPRTPATLSDASPTSAR